MYQVKEIHLKYQHWDPNTLSILMANRKYTFLFDSSINKIILPTKDRFGDDFLEGMYSECLTTREDINKTIIFWPPLYEDENYDAAKLWYELN